MALPLPAPNKQMNKRFMTGVSEGKFGETGPQQAGTRTTVTQYSLDYYLA